LLRWLAALFAAVCVPVWAGNSFRFTETLTDQLLCDDDQGVVSCQTFRSGRFRLDVTVSDEGIDSSQFDKTTPFVITIGDFTFAGTLGDDPHYAAGKTKASFRLTDQVCNGLGKCATLTHGAIDLRITKTGLKITVATRTGADVRGESPALANNYIDDEPGLISDFQPSSASIQLGDHSTSTNLAISATVKQQTISIAGGGVALGNVKLSAFAE
jgi:hypothetical protein